MTHPTRRAFATVLPLACIVPPSTLRAAEEKKANVGDTLNVELPGIILPVAQGRVLRDYLFLTLVVRAGDFPTSEFLRQRHFIVRDALVRGVSVAPIQAGARPGTYDQPGMLAQLTAIIARSGPRLRIVSVTVKDAQFMRG
jgi:hypothetical protein